MSMYGRRAEAGNCPSVGTGILSPYSCASAGVGRRRVQRLSTPGLKGGIGFSLAGGAGGGGCGGPRPVPRRAVQERDDRDDAERVARRPVLTLLLSVRLPGCPLVRQLGRVRPAPLRAALGYLVR